jgi:ribosome-binding protein aMBF1 (putative translation factor)
MFVGDKVIGVLDKHGLNWTADASLDDVNDWHEAERAETRRRRKKDSTPGGKQRGEQQRANVADDWAKLRERARALLADDPDLSEEELAEKLKTSRKRLRKAFGKTY